MFRIANQKTYMFRCLSLLMIVLITSCSSKKVLKVAESGKTIDKRLVGIWEGSEADAQIEGMTKEWKMTRNPNGSFILEFVIKMFGQTEETNEEGRWWVEDGLFYEFHTESGLTDIYNYKILNENEVQFTAKRVSFLAEGVKYEFIDTKTGVIPSK